ncbi:MAG: DNA polymerase III subunit gamma/tau, partial [candidate division WOR-3 bacterium]
MSNHHQPLTLKYRPQTFAELLIQDHVRNTLTQAIERDRLANAYLFAGPRGVGKTTTARILAKCLNCLSHERPTVTPCNSCSACIEISESRSVDVMEIDGASERRIDDVRELRDGIRYSPGALRYKIYIIDEVHMLTREAFNAILKTLEEPPRHAKFIFATTEVHRLPLTIISRCQRFDFRKATNAEICTRLKWIAEKENIKISGEAIAAIATRADGAVRDAESMLEQLAMYSPSCIELSDAEELFGLVPTRLSTEYAELVLAGDTTGIVKLVDRVIEEGHDPVEFFNALVNHFRQLLRMLYTDDLPDVVEEDKKRMRKQAQHFGYESLLTTLGHLSSNEPSIRTTAFPQAFLELLSLELIEKTKCRK